MSNNFKIKKLSLGVATACLATVFCSQSFSAAIEAFDDQDRIATAADVPGYVYNNVDEYPEVYLLKDLEAISMNQQVCFISWMSSPQVPNVRDTRKSLKINHDNELWKAPSGVPEEVKQDPRLVVHASYAPIIEPMSGMDLYPHITEGATARDIELKWRFSQRVIFDFAELYRVMLDKQSYKDWLDPFTLGKQLVEKQTTYYRVCGKKIAERVVKRVNPYLMSFPSASVWEGPVPESVKISELEVDEFRPLTEAEYVAKLSIRNNSRANELAMGDRTPEKAIHGYYDASDMQAAFSDHRNGMYKGINVTALYLTVEVLKDHIRTSDKINQAALDAKAEELNKQ